MPNPEFPPMQNGQPVMTVSQRRVYLDELRFIETRNLAFLQYKKPDQSPLMTYEETLNDRDLVKRTVLAFELSQGWLIPDGTDINQPAPVAQQTQPAVPEGAPQMSQPFQPQPMPQQGQQQMPFAAPQQQAPQTFAPVPMQMQPAPQQMQPQQMMAPPVASPQQAAAVGQPAQQDAPPAAPAGRKRRAAAGGTAVAPPPAAPPQQQAQVPIQQFAAPGQTFAPPQQQQQAPTPFAPQGGAPPMFAAPQAQGFSPPQQPQQQQIAPQQAQQPAPGVDLSPVIGRLDALGKLAEQLGSELAATRKELADSKNSTQLVLAILHHMYLTHPSLGASVADKKTLPDFLTHLQQFVGPR